MDLTHRYFPLRNNQAALLATALSTHAINRCHCCVI